MIEKRDLKWSNSGHTFYFITLILKLLEKDFSACIFWQTENAVQPTFVAIVGLLLPLWKNCDCDLTLCFWHASACRRKYFLRAVVCQKE